MTSSFCDKQKNVCWEVFFDFFHYFLIKGLKKRKKELFFYM